MTHHIRCGTVAPAALEYLRRLLSRPLEARTSHQTALNHCHLQNRAAIPAIPAITAETAPGFLESFMEACKLDTRHVLHHWPQATPRSADGTRGLLSGALLVHSLIHTTMAAIWRGLKRLS